MQDEAPRAAAAAGDRGGNVVVGFALGQEDIQLPGIEEGQGCVYVLAKAAYGLDHFAWKGLVRSFQEPASLLPLFPFSLGGLGAAIFFAVSGFCLHLF